MAGYKHYLPDATGAEQRLLEELANEHPSMLYIQTRETKDGLQIFFEVRGPHLESYVWFLLAKLRQGQRKIAELYNRSVGRKAQSA